MRAIKMYVEQIEEELEGAKDYAEKYVECKAKGNTQAAGRYKEMAMDELKHASYIHDMAVTNIAEIEKIYTPPVDMQEKWQHAHKAFVEKTAWIRQMLAM